MCSHSPCKEKIKVLVSCWQPKTEWSITIDDQHNILYVPHGIKKVLCWLYYQIEHTAKKMSVIEVMKCGYYLMVKQQVQSNRDLILCWSQQTDFIFEWEKPHIRYQQQKTSVIFFINRQIYSVLYCYHVSLSVIFCTRMWWFVCLVGDFFFNSWFVFYSQHRKKVILLSCILVFIYILAWFFSIIILHTLTTALVRG